MVFCEIPFKLGMLNSFGLYIVKPWVSDNVFLYYHMVIVRLKITIGAALVLLSLVFLYTSLGFSKPSNLKIDFLDVGQGDAILVTSPSGVQMLVDAGRNTSVLRALGSIMSFSDRDIDVIVATHPDADHIGGFPGILDRFEVSSFVGSNSDADKEVFRYFSRKIDEEGMQLIEAERGLLIDLGGGVFAQVLFPYAGTIIKSNNSSIILKIIYGDTSILLTGDAGVGVEEYLVNKEGSLLESDVLKLGHHGSKTSTSEKFLEIVQPVMSIISAGKKNSYGHPHQDVLNKLLVAGVSFLGTYKEGTISILSDGQNIWIK